MKKVIVALVVLAVILAAGIWEQFIIDDVFKEFVEQLTVIENNIENIDYALEKTGETVDWWEDRRGVFESLTNHDEIKEIRIRLGELEGYLLSEDSDMARVQAHTLIAFCENVPHLLALHYEHVL